MDKKYLIKSIYEKQPLLSAKEIGKIVGLSRITVSWHLRKLGISRDRKLIQKNNNTKRSFDISISKDAEQIILGSILGDGSITKWKRCEDSHKNLNSSLVICHTSPQKEYIYYKKQLLEKAGIRCRDIQIITAEKIIAKGQHYINNVAVKANDRYNLYTRRAITFNKYRDMYYKESKYINRYTYKLNALGLAIWYMDDGYKHVGTYFFCTNCFSLKDVKLLQKILKHNFNINSTLNKRPKEGQYLIHVCKESSETLKSIIYPYICESMKYKLY